MSDPGEEGADPVQVLVRGETGDEPEYVVAGAAGIDLPEHVHRAVSEGQTLFQISSERRIPRSSGTVVPGAGRYLQLDVPRRCCAPMCPWRTSWRPWCRPRWPTAWPCSPGCMRFCRSTARRLRFPRGKPRRRSAVPAPSVGCAPPTPAARYVPSVARGPSRVSAAASVSTARGVLYTRHGTGAPATVPVPTAREGGGLSRVASVAGGRTRSHASGATFVPTPTRGAYDRSGDARHLRPPTTTRPPVSRIRAWSRSRRSSVRNISTRWAQPRRPRWS